MIYRIFLSYTHFCCDSPIWSPCQNFRGVLGWSLVVVRFAPTWGSFCPHLKPSDLFRLLHAVRHGTEALVYSDYPRETAASSYLSIIFGRILSGVTWFIRSTAAPIQLPQQCRHWCRPWWPYITGYECLISGISHGMNGANLSYCYSGDYPRRR